MRLGKFAFNVLYLVLPFLFFVSAHRDYAMFLAFFLVALWPFFAPGLIWASYLLVKVPP